MRALERRVRNLELLLDIRKFYFNAMEWKRQQDAEEAERRRKAEEERAAAHAAWQAQRAAEAAKRQAEEAARASLPPPVEPRVEPRTPPSPPPEPKPPLWTYDPPPEMQIRPVNWRRSEPYDDGSEDNYGQCIVDYDPLAQEDADYDDS
jgi:hypothetical protein